MRRRMLSREGESTVSIVARRAGERGRGCVPFRRQLQNLLQNLLQNSIGEFCNEVSHQDALKPLRNEG
jgi:hypothetical protein